MSDLDSLLGTALLPFPKIHYRINTDINEFTGNEAYLKCPKCLALDNFYSLSKEPVFEAKFCAGNQPIEVECPSIIGGQPHTHVMSCGGIIEPHFHAHCLVCGYLFHVQLPKRGA